MGRDTPDSLYGDFEDCSKMEKDVDSRSVTEIRRFNKIRALVLCRPADRRTIDVGYHRAAHDTGLGYNTFGSAAHLRSMLCKYLLDRLAKGTTYIPFPLSSFGTSGLVRRRDSFSKGHIGEKCYQMWRGGLMVFLSIV